MSVSGPVSQRLIDSLDESPAMAYLKDLDGRYLHVNGCYEEFFGVTGGDVCGRTDHELTPRQTVDGPRLATGTISEDEPLQLEYTVGPFEGRPALAVWRFVVRRPDSDTAAVCGVAAPVADGLLARRECDRLMAITQDANGAQPDTIAESPTDGDRIAALHEASASAARRAHELLTQLMAERERRSEAEARAAESEELRRRADVAEAAVLTLTAERERRTQTEEEVVVQLRRELGEVEATAIQERERAEAFTAELAAERVRVEQTATELATARSELDAARAELAAERAQHAQNETSVIGDLRQQLETTAAELDIARARADEAEAALISERADAEIKLGVAKRRISELEATLADACARELEEESEHEPSGPQWDSSAQREFTRALSQSSDWRVSVKSAIGVLGTQGGWDAVCAWQPDDQNGFASCFAMWTGEHRRLAALETATWQRRQPLTGSTIGEALTCEEPQWLAADPRADDRRLQLLAQHGIRGALIVPVKDGARPVAALELLTVQPNQPSRELIEAIETMALQLGHFSQLLSAGAQPRWRFGRM